MKQLQIKLSDEMHRMFKRKCILSDKDMSSQIKEWITKFIAKGV